MKRKAIEKIIPLPPTRKGKYITTVQTMDNILILNVYVDGKLRGRHALNPETGEYAQYRAKEKDWKIWKYAALLGLDTSNCGWYSSSTAKERTRFDTQDQEQIVKEKLVEKLGYVQNTFDLIKNVERAYQEEKRDKTESNRVRRVKDKMDLVPEVPEDAKEWIWRQEGAADFAFFNKDTGKWHCTACNKEYEEKFLRRLDQGNKIRHNDKVVCPRCKSVVTAKKRNSSIEQKTHFCLFQKIDSRMSVLRYFDVRMLWNYAGRRVGIDEAVRILLYHTSTLPKYYAEIFYNQNYAFYGNGYFDNKRNPANRREYAGFLYPKEIEEALEDTAFQAWGRLFTQLSAAGQKLNYNRLLVTQDDPRMARVVECLFKGKFNRLLYETSEQVSYWDYQYHGVLNLNGKNIEEVFGIPDRQTINRIRDLDGGKNILLWLRWGWEHRQKIPQELLEWLNDNNIRQMDMNFIKNKMSAQQVMNYVRKQQAEGYKGKTAREVMSQWADYLNMLHTLGKGMKIEDEMMYRPRELKRRHDECVEEINRQKILEEMKRNPRERAAEAKRMRDKFPGAEDVLKEIKSKYEYQNDKYIILVPQKLIDIVTEGQALHHCAGATDRYFDRIMQRETYICFLRKKDYPEVPFYTIEVEPGGTIRQHRGMYDEEPGIQKIKPFLREWQKEIKKRLNQRDHEYAQMSAIKRQENIEELRAKNNTRVLNGLMEDFMEAI